MSSCGPTTSGPTISTASAERSSWRADPQADTGETLCGLLLHLFGRESVDTKHIREETRAMEPDDWSGS
jgi:hypothetical protein